MGNVQVDGKQAFYSCPIDVRRDRKKGKVVLLVHGARSNHKIWAPQVRALSAEHTPIAVDLPGHGYSEGAGSREVSEYKDFLKGFVDALELDRFVIVGHSMGGSIALAYVLEHTGVEALIPVGSAPNWDIPADYLDLFRTDPILAIEMGKGRNFAKNTPKAIVELNEWNSKTTPLSVGLGDLEACNAFNVVPQLDKINLPTCIICGEEDAYVDGSKLLHERLKGSNVHWIKNAGHDPSIEQPLETNRVLLDFLGTLN